MTVRAFCESLAEASADAIAITGDTSDGSRLERHLSLIAESVQKPIFLLWVITTDITPRLPMPKNRCAVSWRFILMSIGLRAEKSSN